MSLYRKLFLWATVLTNDALAEHVVPWLPMWHVGFGLMGETGCRESIHA